jgi:hypothetical protein
VLDPHEIALAVYDHTGDNADLISEVASVLAARVESLREEREQPVLRLVAGGCT